jgi:hypothetical protein
MIDSSNRAAYHSANEHETKFVCNNSIALSIIRWLQCRCQVDPEFPAGIVSSIYYDTRDWQFLREKVNSDYLKSKIRLRWYADIDDGEPGEVSYIEAKYKIGSRRQKIRIRTEFSGKWLCRVSLDNKKLFGIPHLLRSRGVAIADTLYPAFQISYKRYRFIDLVTGARLCLDYDIRVPSVNRQMLGRSNPFRISSAVFELKGPAIPTKKPVAQLPDVLHQLTAMGCQKQSFSKYSNCYQKIMGTNF